MQTYSLSVLGLLVLCLFPILTAILVGVTKGRAGALPGPVIPADYNNPLYRMDRVHMNSVETLALFTIPAVLAMLLGVAPTTLATLVWLFTAIRVLHLAVYLRGGNAAKSGNLRTIIFILGTLVTLVLMVITGLAAM